MKTRARRPSGTCAGAPQDPSQLCPGLSRLPNLDTLISETLVASSEKWSCLEGCSDVSPRFLGCCLLLFVEPHSKNGPFPFLFFWINPQKEG
jgi:hypothetical protein